MVEALHSIYLKHDTGLKSLTKRALAQVILKMVFIKGDGIGTSKIKDQLGDLTGVRFEVKDIEAAIGFLRNQNKLHSKSGKHYINESYKPILQKATTESEFLHKDVVEHWFSNSETFREKDKSQEIYKWFQSLLIEFFKQHSYDWVFDLRTQAKNGKTKKVKIETLIEASFKRTNIYEADKKWLAGRFIGFLESDRKNDNDLLWIYGSSMFSSTLLTARNYADDFTIEVFKDSVFILDTNILMILELEGFEFNYALKTIENIFQQINIEPGYFFISREEYIKALGNKMVSTLNSLKKFDVTIFESSTCPFVITALARQCKTEEDFERFFIQLNQIPQKFYEKLDLKCIDYSEINSAIESGQTDPLLLDRIDKVHIRRTNQPKRQKAKIHDAGLIRGAEYLKNTRPCWILTMDGTLREYSNEFIVRDSNPIAISLESLIQILAINSGGTELSSTNYAPLFGKLIRASIMPEKETFHMEDLNFILDTRIEIEKLPKEEIIKVASLVNKLRLKGTPDEDIILEIRRVFQSQLDIYKSRASDAKDDATRIQQERDMIGREKDAMKSTLLASLIELKTNKLKLTIFWNYARTILLFLSIAVLCFLVLYLSKIKNNIIDLIISIIVGVIPSLIFMFQNNLKFKIRSSDIEKIKSEAELEIRSIKGD